MFLSKTNVNSALSKNEAIGVDHELGTLHQKKQVFSSTAIFVYFILTLPLKSEGKKVSEL